MKFKRFCLPLAAFVLPIAADPSRIEGGGTRNGSVILTVSRSYSRGLFGALADVA
jgi:hypothetical protein